MSKTWVYSDPHFGHKNILNFTVDDEGTRLRPLWDNINDMNHDMIKWYNEIVDDEDRVYILGDVAFSNRVIQEVVPQLKGRKCLVPGNHEPPKMRQWFHLYDDVRGYVQRNGFIMSHIPIHPGSLGRWGLNIHGHTHANVVTMEEKGRQVPDIRYYSVCVERTDFRPKMLDDILKERDLR